MHRLTDGDRDRIRILDRIETPASPPDAGVVVVTHDSVDASELHPTLEALADQTVANFEVVLVDNSPTRDLRSTVAGTGGVHVFVALEQNYGVNLARNLGSRVVEGRVLIFMDHDAVPRCDFVAEHLRAHAELDIFALRGRVRPKTSSMYNALTDNYDLGDEPFPYFLDIEGNCSVERETYETVSGFDEDVWGHEGLRLSAKIIEERGPDSIIYYPDAVVYHDFATSLYSLVKKKARHARASDRLQAVDEDVTELYQFYAPPPNHADRPLVSRVGRYLAHRVTNAAGRLLYPVLFSENSETE